MAFLTNYNNAEYEAIPANKKHRLYPYGGTMPIIYWGYPAGETTSFRLGQKLSDLQRLVDNGFTGMGMNYGQDPMNNQDYAEAAGKMGLRHYVNLGGCSNGHMTLCCNGDYVENADYIGSRVKGYMEEYIGDPRWNNYIDWWYSRPEEAGERMDYSKVCSTNPSDPDYNKSCRASVVQGFLKKMRIVVNNTDSEKRPFMSTDLSGTNASQYTALGKYRDCYTAQTYTSATFKSGSSGVPGYYPTGITQETAKRTAEALRTQTYDSTVWTAKKPAIVPLIGSYQNLFFAPRTKESWFDYMAYMVFVNMTMGAHGYMIYRWDFPSCCDLNEQPEDTCTKNSSTNTYCYGGYTQQQQQILVSRDGIIDFNKMFTDNNFHNACLWGKDMKGLTNGIGVSYSGSATAHINTGGSGTDIKVITYLDKQLGIKRYLAFANSHWSETRTVTITGLPTGKYITKLKQDITVQISSSTMTFSLSKEDWAAFVVSDNPPNPPSTPTAPTFSANNVDPGDSVTLSSSTTGATSVQWQRKRSGGSWSNI